MNIKLGKVHRLRLIRQEFELLSRGGILREVFTLSPALRLEVEIICDKSSTSSKLTCFGKSLRFFICGSDLESMVHGENRKSGVTVDNFTFQVDLWSENVRDRLEAHDGP